MRNRFSIHPLYGVLVVGLFFTLGIGAVLLLLTGSLQHRLPLVVEVGTIIAGALVFFLIVVYLISIGLSFGDRSLRYHFFAKHLYEVPSAGIGLVVVDKVLFWNRVSIEFRLEGRDRLMRLPPLGRHDEFMAALSALKEHQ